MVALAKSVPNFEEELRNIVVQAGTSLQMPELQGDPIVLTLYNLMFADGPSKVTREQRKRALHAALVRKDTALLQSARKLFQELLVTLKLDDLSAFSGELVIGPILSYYTLFDPQEGEQIKIPKKVSGEWILADYVFEKIFLTPPWLGSQVTAFGLHPVAKGLPPLLLFKGTSYPTDNGFALGVLSDLNPGASVGAYIFWFGKKKISAWLESASEKAGCKAQVSGLSLGGSLALHTVAKLPTHIDRVFAFHPSALLSYDLKAWDQSPLNSLPEVHIICNENDLVPTMGLRWGKGWNIYRIFLPERRPSLHAHMQCFAARKNHLMLRANRKRDETKWSRIGLASARLTLSIPLFLIRHFYTIYLLVQLPL